MEKKMALSAMLILIFCVIGTAQDGVLKKNRNYKTHSAGKKMDIKAVGELNEMIVAQNYKKPKNLSQTIKVQVEVSKPSLRNYKMNKKSV